MTRLYVDVHVLQTVPPSNLNRDDAGSPKQAVYGGVRRIRVSSQAWKRATRRAFDESDVAGALPRGTRTKKLRGLLERRWIADGIEQAVAREWSESALDALKVTLDGKKKENTSYLLFLGYEQVHALAEYVRQAKQDGSGGTLDAAAMQKLLDSGHPLDVALFGRMVADVAQLNVDAAVQVAHALSTHAVDIEFDYFTAVEDESDEDETGAGMIGTVEFASATLYRYATVAVHGLQENLQGSGDEAVERAVSAFLHGFVRSLPTGKQTTFAHHTAPEAVCLVVREDQPVNLVSAFEEAVTRDPTTGEGIASRSTRRLAEELERSTRLWGRPPALVVSTYAPRPGSHALEPLGQPTPWDDAVEAVARVVRERTALAAGA